MAGGSLGPESVRTGGSRSARVIGPLPKGELVFALLMVALGVFALVGVFTIHVPTGAQVGPTVFPVFVATLLLGAAVAVLISILRGQRGVPEDGEDVDQSLPTDWITLVKIAALLLAHLLLIEPIGWAPAAALLFGGVAWSLGARRWWVALLIGVAVALVVQVAFGGFLGLSLPWGPALSWLGRMF
ncbi:tripartite tricarboxylate transporter TctB family protein [Microbacterium sp. 3J1]|uniref:tripartite tricarboxylate transporter TctB family protein n=1 Tax=Microbacterium sp. 3J1 TaxID=861269 RepID=UPI000B196CB8|nr:tripartite tricarboxylate transporter TctB family protein [Microbacterium sp. 3J1]